MLTLGLLSLLIAADVNWPQWRGPAAAGISESTSLPTTWSPGNNIAWKIEVPGSGHSQPVIWGNHVFLTTALEGDLVEGAGAVKHKMGETPFLHPDSVGATRKQTLKMLCYDAANGKLLWERTAFEGTPYDNRHKRNTYASPTVATDGTVAIAYFESMGLYAYSPDGKLLWKTSIGGVGSFGMGPGTSPILSGDLVIIQNDEDEGKHSFLIAFAKKDGKEVWRTPRKVQASWSTPVLAGDKLIASGSESIVAYDPKTGKELWTVAGLKSYAIHTPLVDGDMVIVTSGFPAKRSIGIRTDGEVVWKYEKGTAYVPSPILYRGLLYLLTDNGTMTCLDPKTGKPVYEGKRLPAPAKFMASPVAFDGKILLTSEDGDTYIVKAGPEHEVLGKNTVDEPVYSSMALAGDSIYIRAEKHLYRIRK